MTSFCVRFLPLTPNHLKLPVIPYQPPDQDPHSTPYESTPTEHARYTTPDPTESSEWVHPGVDGRETVRFELVEADAELGRVHAREIASLLRQATALRVACSMQSAYPLPLRPQSLRLWRSRARKALELLALDGWRSPGSRWLHTLVRRKPERWPKAHELAEAARTVEDSEFARVCLGWALLADGECARAERVFVDLLRKLEVLRHRWRVFEGRAHAHAAIGRWRLAHAALESASEAPHCGISVLVEALHLALRIGEPELVRRAAARLDLLIDPSLPEFSAALGLLRIRRGVYGGLELASDGETRRLFEDLARVPRSPSGRVARLLR